jgi:hypothetical protein
MSEDNRIINGLWIGNELSNLELLTIHSFVNNGHEFHLWSYNNFKEALPEGAVLKDANEIIFEKEIFRYEEATVSGIGNGSVAGFSDIFRYKLLYEKGGWWVDMDVTCLKPFDLQQPYLFPKDNNFPFTGKVLKSKAKSQLMLDCYMESIEKVDKFNTDWGKPIRILINNVKKYNLIKYVVPEFINYDSFIFVDLYRHYDLKMPTQFYAFHWSHELWRSYKIDKNKFKLDSTYGKLLETNNLVEDKVNCQWENDLSILKHLQLILFKFLYKTPFLWKVLKKLKNKISIKYNLWIP